MFRIKIDHLNPWTMKKFLRTFKGHPNQIERKKKKKQNVENSLNTNYYFINQHDMRKVNRSKFTIIGYIMYI